jgi:ubiquinone/menaquinone biosynthesis C-methylase UbiE
MARSASINYWPNSACARAFWGQQEHAPYKELLNDTVQWLNPEAGQRWLDLGCGCGKLTEALWLKSLGSVAEIVGVDVAAVNEVAFERLRQRVRPAPRPDQVRFRQCDFSGGLASWPDGQFDGVVSGLAIQYAERFSEAEGRWTTEAYDRLLRDVYRVLRPGGTFVFSVNVPEPAWGRVALHSLPGLFRRGKIGRRLSDAWRMYRYGRWLTRESRRGRFHYLPIETIAAKLAAASFGSVEHRHSYVGQAYVVRCGKR